MSHLMTEVIRKAVKGIHDLIVQESHIRFILKDSTGMKEPVLAKTFFIDREIIALVWKSDSNERSYFLFPISSLPGITNLEDWNVIFIGTAAELQDTRLAKKIRHFPEKIPTEETFCLITRSHDVCEKDLVTRCAISIRTDDDDKKVRPKSYCYWKYF